MNDKALLELLAWLDREGYDFVPPTPLTHRRLIANGGAARTSVARRLFGWSYPVHSGEIPPDLMALMAASEVLEWTSEGIRSSVRVARLGTLLLHSAFPTDAAHSVFMGPDSYRFARLIQAELDGWTDETTLVDMGTGSGVGALVAGAVLPGARIVGTDINPAALRLARVNATYAGRKIELVQCSSVDKVDGRVDIAIANPPYIVDSAKRHYRNGGGPRGTSIALDMAGAALDRLEPGGRLILYSGSPIVDGTDEFRGELEMIADIYDSELRYEELDPDIFGEELDHAAYDGVERIALVAAILDRR